MKQDDAYRLVAQLLMEKQKDAAKEVLVKEIPFEPMAREKRNFTIRQRMEVFVRDGFVDRYSGEKMINPGFLRLLSILCPKEFPYQGNWKIGECHFAYWERFPTVDHIFPIARGGADSAENMVTTNMKNNQIKANWTLEEVGWEVKPAGDINQWDGLSKEFVILAEQRPWILKRVKNIRDWYQVTKSVMGI